MHPKKLLENLGYSEERVTTKGWSKMVRDPEEDIPVWVSKYGALRLGHTFSGSYAMESKVLEHPLRNWQEEQLTKRSTV